MTPAPPGPQTPAEEQALAEIEAALVWSSRARSTHEIATRLGCSRQAVDIRLRAALTKLRKRTSKEWAPNERESPASRRGNQRSSPTS